MSKQNDLTFLYRFIVACFSHKTEQKIWGFKALEAGWHFGEGKPIEDAAIFEALQIHGKILSRGFPITNAFPGLNGEILLTVYSNKNYFEFTREQNGEWTFIHEHSDEEVDLIENITFNDAESIIGTLQERIWNTSEFYHESTGMLRSSGLYDSPLSPPVTAAEFPSSRKDALLMRHNPFVPTSEGTTPRLQVIRRYSGSFQMITSRRMQDLCLPRALRGIPVTGTLSD